jgi:hypothetical protein
LFSRTQILNEIMILGVISFGVFVAEQAFDLSTREPGWFHALEWCHILIFFLAVLYAMQSAWILLIGESFLQFVDQCIAKPPRMLQDEAQGKRKRSLQTYSHELRLNMLDTTSQLALRRECEAMIEVLRNAGSNVKDPDVKDERRSSFISLGAGASPKGRMSKLVEGVAGAAAGAMGRKSNQPPPRSPKKQSSNALPAHALKQVILEGGAGGSANISMGSSQVS